jgi:hypothetical protein
MVYRYIPAHFEHCASPLKHCGIVGHSIYNKPIKKSQQNMLTTIHSKTIQLLLFFMSMVPYNNV